MEYSFDPVDHDCYHFNFPESELKYCRFGGRQGQERINELDLGFVDPSGGPFISIGYKIDGREVKNISYIKDKIFLYVF